MLGPNPEGNGALEVLAVIANRGDEVPGDVLVEPPGLASCSRHRLWSPGGYSGSKAPLAFLLKQQGHRMPRLACSKSEEEMHSKESESPAP